MQQTLEPNHANPYGISTYIGDVQVGYLGTNWSATDPWVAWMMRLDAAGIWPRFEGVHRLTTNERKALEEDIKYLEQIEKTAVEARNAARQLGFTGEKWDPIIQSSVEMINRATTIREAEPS